LYQYKYAWIHEKEKYPLCTRHLRNIRYMICYFFHHCRSSLKAFSILQINFNFQRIMGFYNIISCLEQIKGFLVHCHCSTEIGSPPYEPCKRSSNCKIYFLYIGCNHIFSCIIYCLQLPLSSAARFSSLLLILSPEAIILTNAEPTITASAPALITSAACRPLDIPNPTAFGTSV